MIANIVLEVMILAAVVQTALLLARWKAGMLSPPLTLTSLARVAGGLTLVLAFRSALSKSRAGWRWYREAPVLIPLWHGLWAG